MQYQDIDVTASRRPAIHNLPLLTATATLLLALISALGWGLDAQILKTFMPDMPSMKLSTASMLGALALALFLSDPAVPQKHPQWLVVGCVGYVLTVSVVYLLLGHRFEPRGTLWLAPSPATSLALLLLALALQLLQLGRPRVQLIAVLCVCACLLPLHRLMTFILGSGTLQMAGPFESMSLPTALGLCFLAIGLLFHPRLPYIGQLLAGNLQGRLLRIALPWTLLAPSLLSVLFATGISMELYQLDFVLVALTIGLSVMMTVLLWRFTMHLQRTDDLRIEAQKTLQQSEAHANLIIDTAPDAMVVADEQGVIQRVNARMEQLFGYSRDEMLGRPLSLLLPERYRQGHETSVNGYFSAPRTRFMGEGRDLFARRKGGQEIAVEIGLAPLETSQGRHVLANIVDITGRLQAQAQIEAALQEKTLLLNEIHHRVKNNLQIVASLLSLQAGRVGDARFSALIAESESRVQAMALMHQVLYERKDFARVELDIYLERLSGLLAQIHGAGSRGIRVRLDVERITLDLTRAIPLGLIVNELLCNAFKHAFPDGAGGEVRVELHAKDGSGASLQVRDNGQGLAGRQASQTGDTLGMQIVTLLAEQIGGELAACRGSGACFELRFTPCSDGEGNDEECGKTE